MSRQGVIPGPDPGACPTCGGWRKAGMVHECRGQTPEVHTMELLFKLPDRAVQLSNELNGLLAEDAMTRINAYYDAKMRPLIFGEGPEGDG